MPPFLSETVAHLVTALFLLSFAHQSTQDIPRSHARSHGFKQPVPLKKQINYPSLQNVAFTPLPEKMSSPLIDEYSSLAKEALYLERVNVTNQTDSFGRAVRVQTGRAGGMKASQQTRSLGSGSGSASGAGSKTNSQVAERRALIVIEKVNDLESRFSKYKRGDTPGKSGRFVGILKRPMGRGVMNGDNDGDSENEEQETSKPETEMGKLGRAVNGGGESADDAKEDPSQELDIDDTGPDDDAPPLRVWGDECTPAENVYDDDDCSKYTKFTFGATNNAKQLSCDDDDKICLCNFDEHMRRAEFSKELQICLLPRFYRCNSTAECEPLLTCSKATKRDYELDPAIPQGFPNICRLMLNLTNEGVPSQVHQGTLLHILLFIAFQFVFIFAHQTAEYTSKFIS